MAERQDKLVDTHFGTSRLAANERKDIKNSITEALLHYHAQMVEGGQPNHIISNVEAQQLLGAKNHNDLGTKLRRIYKHANLDYILKNLGLPHNDTSAWEEKDSKF